MSFCPLSALGAWDRRFLGLSEVIASWSKDPSTKVGSVIVRRNQTIAATGFNGLPRGVEDRASRLEDRDTKLALTIHAEENAIISAATDLNGCTLYVWPLPPCSTCAAKIIQVGIVRVVCPVVPKESRWHDKCQLGLEILQEAGVEVEVVYG